MFKFPYTNLHELNLNWIIRKLKSVLSMKVNVENSTESGGSFDENTSTLTIQFPFGAPGPQGPQGPEGPGIEMPCIVMYEPSYAGTLIWSVDLNHSADEYYKLEETFVGTLGSVSLNVHVDVAGQPQVPVYSNTFERGEVAYITIEVISNWVTLRDDTTGEKLFQVHDPAGVLKIEKTVEHGWRYQRVEMYPEGA